MFSLHIYFIHLTYFVNLLYLDKKSICKLAQQTWVGYICYNFQSMYEVANRCNTSPGVLLAMGIDMKNINHICLKKGRWLAMSLLIVIYPWHLPESILAIITYGHLNPDTVMTDLHVFSKRNNNFLHVNWIQDYLV